MTPLQYVLTYLAIAITAENKLFKAFHTLGEAVRKDFLMHYLSDVKLRTTIERSDLNGLSTTIWLPTIESFATSFR